MNQILSGIHKNKPLAAGASLLIIYICIRSGTVDITHDEAWSFQIVKKFWHVEALCTGNTHWLNSIAMKIAIVLHCERTWQLRWFSTLSAITFCIVCFLWIRSLEKLHVRVFACLLLLFNPYVLGYLGMARGYSSGLMFESLSLYLLMINSEKHKRRLAFIALLSASLSAIANYSFIYFFAAFALVYFYKYYLKPADKFGFLKNKNFYLDLFLTLGTFAFIIRAFIFIIRCSADVVGAGTDNIEIAARSIAESLLNRNINLGNAGSIILSCLLLLAIGIVCLYGLFKFKHHQNKAFFCSSLILSLIFMIISINYSVFKVVLPCSRSALFLFPIISVNLIYFLNQTSGFLLNKIAITALSLLLLFNFIRSANFTRTLDFSRQEETKKVFDYLDSIHANQVAVSWILFGVYKNYYQMTDHFKYRFKAETLNQESRLADFDYVLLSPPDSILTYKTEPLRIDTLKRFPKNNILLLKCKGEKFIYKKGW